MLADVFLFFHFGELALLVKPRTPLEGLRISFSGAPFYTHTVERSSTGQFDKKSNSSYETK
jgi:hypothetical protein